MRNRFLRRYARSNIVGAIAGARRGAGTAGTAGRRAASASAGRSSGS